ncbi:3-oxoacyl-ACP synthase III [Schlesneria paludicola]|uniref:3-oxoacyl-ACP synthase III n=1 Tax=Schlesneria paludicola TaxID=360056 RepID=UPI00029B0A7C|nr:3-oxoacyl-ACP synthase III [Schlesneria paludicola]
MKYSRVYIDAIGYELAPVVVTSAEIEARLEPLYQKLKIPNGQLAAWTGINERRWWPAGHRLSDGATEAARRALEHSNVAAEDIGVLIYAGVCREQFEPATACSVAANLTISPDASVFDVSNACLGVLNGMVDIANRIELGQIRAGIVVSCETAREIIDYSIQRLLEDMTMEAFTTSLATLTGGSGAVAVLLTDGSFSRERSHRLLGGVTKAAPEHHALCRWGFESLLPAAISKVDAILPPSVTHTKFGSLLPSLVQEKFTGMLPARLSHAFTQFMQTDSISVLKHGVDLGMSTWRSFLTKIGFSPEQIDKVICHQVGKGHREQVLSALGISQDKDFCTYPYLGNIGTVSLPLTAAIADERGFLNKGDRVGFLGIGSGLNCLMLAIDW